MCGCKAVAGGCIGLHKTCSCLSHCLFVACLFVLSSAVAGMGCDTPECHSGRKNVEEKLFAIHWFIVDFISLGSVCD